MIFDGNPRRGRKINLGGSRHTSSRADVLRNAEQQRLKRDQARREQAAVQTLQAFWQGRKAQSEVRRAVLTDFTEGDGFTNPPTVIDAAFSLFLPALLPIKSQAEADELSRLLARLAELGVVHGTRLALSLIPVFGPSEFNISAAQHFALKLLGLVDIDRSWVGVVARALLHADPHLDPQLTAVQLERLSSLDPDAFLRAVLNTDAAVISWLPLQVLTPALGITNSNFKSEPVPNRVSLVQKLAPYVSEAWQLVAVLIGGLPPLPGSHLELQPLYSREFVASHVHVGAELATYFLKIIELLPNDRSEILLQLALPSSPSLIQSLWQQFAATDLCALCLKGPEMLAATISPDELDRAPLLGLLVCVYSYWLLVATDDSFLFGSDRTLSRDNLEQLSTVLRNLCFTLLWQWDKEPASQTLTVRHDLFVLMRQIYTRDSRRRFLPPQFWLMESHMAEWVSSAVSDEALAEHRNEDEDEEAPIVVVQKSRPLEVLRQAPFFTAFTTRATLLRQFIDKDRVSYPPSINSAMVEFGRQHFPINRESLLEDAQTAFATLKSRLKNDLAVQFLSGNVPESGIDGGGLTKELLTAICTDVFKSNTKSAYSSLFQETPNHTLYPAPQYSERGKSDDGVRGRYIFLGETIAKCLYENILVDVEFAPFFLAKWAGESSVRSSFDDLFLLDEDLYASLVKLYNYDHVEELELDFTTVGSGGQIVQLRPHGDQIEVTNANKLEYIRQLAHYKLNVSLGPQTRWFLEGMSSVISLNWLKMFNPHEIQSLISGRSRDVDLEDLKRNTELFGFGPNSPTINNLWQVLQEDLTPEQRGEFLKFVTSVPRAPLLGFQQLQPHFGIRSAGPDDQRLPTSSTCVNLLKLPDYSSRSILKQKLLYAIEAKAGFDLS